MIRRLLMLVIFMLLGLYTFVQAQDATLWVCRYPDGVYQFAYEGIVDEVGFNNAIWYDLDTLTAAGYGVEFYVWRNTSRQSIFGYPDATACTDKNQSDVWHPGAVSILLPASGSGPYLIEIQDTYGHWSLVTDKDHPDGIALYNKGGFVELIGSPDQDTNPEHYRLVEVTND